MLPNLFIENERVITLIKCADGSHLAVIKVAALNVGSIGLTYKPEFLNRLDDIVVFDRLKKDQLRSIIQILIQKIQDRLADHQLTIKVDEKAIELLIFEGYDPRYGARPLKRVVENRLQNKLAQLIIKGDVPPGSVLNITAKDNAIEVIIK